jgi:hypothetical protein
MRPCHRLSQTVKPRHNSGQPSMARRPHRQRPVCHGEVLQRTSARGARAARHGILRHNATSCRARVAGCRSLGLRPSGSLAASCGSPGRRGRLEGHPDSVAKVLACCCMSRRPARKLKEQRLLPLGTGKLFLSSQA